MKKILLAFVILFTATSVIAEEYELLSPDGKIKVIVNCEQKIYYEVLLGDAVMIAPSQISMHTEQHGAFGIDPIVKSEKRNTVDQMHEPVVRQKSAEIRENYNELHLIFKGNYALNFRAFNEGVAYRWESSIKDDLIIVSEEANFLFAKNHTMWFPEEESMFSHQEREYLIEPISSITADRFCSTPTLLYAEEAKIVISEAGLWDYPGMYLMGMKGAYILKGKFPRVVMAEDQTSDRDVRPVERADYIAKTWGVRNFPWRVIAIAPEDGDLITNQMIYMLSDPCRIEDPSWIKPGKVAWDWWNFLNVYDVPFEAGLNTETYKYYIDFAHDFGIEYIILDEGWYELGDLMAINPDIDMQELLAYGREKGVGIILWVVWKTLDDQLDEVMPLFEDWGIAGLKVDFMQRDDQWMVNYYWKIAEESARRKFLVDFHGSYKPAGLHRTFPNVITREGIRGLEWSKWSDKATPKMAVTLPFIRMLSGPMDYTPGAMINATEQDFNPVFARPMSQGTRAHQLAMYVVFESPLQMLADNPTHYRKEPICMEFLSKVPTVWDETIVLEAKLGEYVIIARRKGYEWYIGAMTNRRYEMTEFRDGPNAHRNAQDFVKEATLVDRNETVSIKLAPGGGWAAILSIVRY